MGPKKWAEKLLIRKKTRRDFIADQIKLVAAGALFPWPLSKLVQVRAVDTPEPGDDAKKAKGMKTTVKPDGAKAPIHALAKPFMGENLKYELTFLWVVSAAEGSYSFKQGIGQSYVGRMEAKAAGLVGKLTNYRNLKLISTMYIKAIDGVERFVTSRHAMESRKKDGTYHSTWLFNYKSNRMRYTKKKNDAIIKKKTRRIKGGKPWDDFVVASYNFRNGAYGKLDYGKKFTINTIPHKKVSTFSFRIATKEEMKKEKRLISKHKGTKYMAVVVIDKKIFGIKTGQAFILGDNNFKPLAATVEDVVHFGNVVAALKR